MYEPLCSSFFKPVMDYKFTAIVNVDDKTYLIDSCDTADNGYELMVFAVSEHFDNASEKHYNLPMFGHKPTNILTEELDKVTDYADLYANRYDSIEEAEEEFDRLLNADELKKVLVEADEYRSSFYDED